MERFEISIKDLFEKRRDRIPVVTVEKSSGRILGLNFTSEETFRKTVASGKCHYYDEVNSAVFLKGEHSGEVEDIITIRLDCCHARRHRFHLLYEVAMADGECKFGMSDCHFYRYEDGRFLLDNERIVEPDRAKQHESRIRTILDSEEDIRHMKRFSDSSGE